MALSTKEKIVALKTNNPKMSAKEIAKQLKTKASYVYTSLSLARKASPKGENPFTPIVKELEERVQANRNEAALMTLRNQNSALNKEINELTTIIAYLEHRCYRAESKHGSPV